MCGAAPLGWYTGRDSPQTRRLVVEHGGLLYDSDSYADDLPYWTRVAVGDGGHEHEHHRIGFERRCLARHGLPAARLQEIVERVRWFRCMVDACAVDQRDEWQNSDVREQSDQVGDEWPLREILAVSPEACR